MSVRVKELVDAGLVLSRAGDKDGARRLAEEALRLDPLSLPAQELMAELMGQPVASINPFAPPPPDLFGELTLRSAPSLNPFAKPARVVSTEPPAAAATPPTMPSGVASARPSTSASPTPAPVLPPAPPVPAELPPPLPSSESIHPFTLPAGLAIGPPQTPPPVAEPIHPVTLPAGLAMGGARLTPMPMPRLGRPPSATDAMSLLDSAVPGGPSRRSTPPPVPVEEDAATTIRRAQDLMNFADHSGALVLLERVLRDQPGQAEALALRARCEATLVSMFESKLGDLNRKPSLRLRADEVIWLNLDHRAGFVLAQIDGTVSLDDLFALSGMNRLDTARILAQLVEEKVIGT